ncbi:MAG: hypothetical protein ACREUE_09925 [Panacagrimonas sp.]
MNRLLIAGAVLLLQGCVYLPETRTWYDEQCQIYSKHMTLRAHQVGAIGNCVNRDCVGVLAIFGVVSAASAVVSGSIVVVGNTVYWLEQKGKCLIGA